MPTVQGLYMETELPPFNADLIIWYDKKLAKTNPRLWTIMLV